METLLFVFTWIIGAMLITAFGLMAWKTWKTGRETEEN